MIFDSFMFLFSILIILVLFGLFACRTLIMPAAHGFIIAFPPS